MIHFKEVAKSYHGRTVIEGLNLQIERGEFLVLLGASGSGKSTMLQMINRLVSYDAGELLFDGQRLESLPINDLRRRMGYAIQSVGLFPHWTVARNIATVPQLLGWSKARIAARVEELMVLLQLDPGVYRDRYPHQLSGGQQQRVGVARALAAGPDVLLMDEPFGALDPVTRRSLQIELKRIHAQSNTTVVLVTHDVDEALLLGTRLVLLDAGRIVQQGSPQELLAQPANDFVRDFLGSDERGLRLLSLRSVGELMVAAEPISETACIDVQTSLRDAVSRMTLEGSQVLNVINAQGQHLGVLQAEHLFAGLGQKTAEIISAQGRTA